MTNKGRFAVDTKGFRTQCLEIGIPRLIGELKGNVFDLPEAKNCWVEISQHGDIIHIKVRDDGNGFQRKEEIYTLFADSKKRDDPTLRGRFNLAEKQFLAVCEDAYVKTNNSHFIFGKGQWEEKRLSKKFDGTEIFGRIRIDEDSTDKTKILEYLNRIAVPDGKTVFLNGIKKETTPILKRFTAKLMTPTTPKNSTHVKMRERLRETEIFLYDTKGETSWIYEMGIPIRELDGGIRWHIDIQQKVPQVSERNQAGKTPAYLKSVYQVVAENCQDLITHEDADKNWTTDAWEKADTQTAQRIIDLKYGTEDNPHPKLMIKSTTNSQANEEAEQQNFVVVDGRELSKEIKENLKSNGQIENAGLVFKEQGLGSHAIHVEQTDGMIFFGKFCKLVAEETIGKDIEVLFVKAERDRLADYGGSTLRWNVTTLGRSIFDKKDSERLLGILIHELAHDRFGNHDGTAHLSHDYLHEQERIAGICFKLGLEHFLDKLSLEIKQ